MDVLVCNFPPMLSWYLPAAPAILLGACNWLGLTSEYIDFNNESDNWAKLVADKNPKLLALSIFSYKSQQYAEQLATEIKLLNPDIKIIIGGSGIRTSINGSLEYVEKLLANTVIDYYIDGDAEQQWPTFLNKFFNLTKPVNYTDLTTPYLPDYSKYNVNWHRKAASALNLTPHVPITGSRGCIRRCTFCEIHQHWKYAQRLPDSIVAEIRHILAVIPDAQIHFTDSLVNGSLTTFNNLLDQLVVIKKEYPLFTWSGQFIIRIASQSSEKYWKKIAQSGAKVLEIGVETGSDRLRIEMKKGFLNKDLDHSLYFMEKYNIACVFLMFVGYPTETEEDFTETVLMFDRYKQYAKTIIKQVALGYNFSIHPGTPIYDISTKPDSGIVTTKDPIVWFNKNNPSLTFTNRVERRRLLQDSITKLGYELAYDNNNAIAEAETTYQQNQKIIELIEKQR